MMGTGTAACLLWGKASDNRLATVKPEVPPPATMKSYWGRSCETWRRIAGCGAPAASPTIDATMAHDRNMVALSPLWQMSEMLQSLGLEDRSMEIWGQSRLFNINHLHPKADVRSELACMSRQPGPWRSVEHAVPLAAHLQVQRSCSQR